MGDNYFKLCIVSIMTFTCSMFDKTAYILVRIRAGTLHDVHSNETV